MICSNTWSTSYHKTTICSCGRCRFSSSCRYSIQAEPRGQESKVLHLHQLYSWMCFHRHQDRNKSKSPRLILGLFSVSIKSLRSLNNAYKEILLPREFCTSCERTIVSHLTPGPGEGIIHLNTAV